MTKWPVVAVLVAMCALRTGSTAAPDGVELRRVQNGGLQPEAVVDARGVLHLLYFNGEPAAGDLFYTTSRDAGSTFSPPVRVNSQAASAIATGTIRGGQLALGRSGVVHVGWTGSSTAQPRGIPEPHNKKPGAPYLYTRSNPAGTAFEAQRNLNDRGYGLDGGSLTADADGHVYAAWHAIPGGDPGDEQHRRMWLAASADDGRTFETRPIESAQPGICACCGARVFAAGARSLLLLFRSALVPTERDMMLLSSNDAGRTFTTASIQKWELSACPMTSASVASSDAATLAAWQTGTQVYVGRIDPKSGKVLSATAAPGEAPARKHPRLAIDGNRVLMVWTEGTAWAKGGSIRWQELDLAGRPSGASGSVDGLPVWSFATPVPRPGGGFTILY